MPGQDVDGATLAEVVEPEFERRLPPEVSQDPDRALDQCRVGRVDETIELGAPPTRLEDDLDVHRRRDAANGLDREAAHVPSLEERDVRLRHASRRREVFLAEASPVAYRPDDCPQSLVVHVGSMTRDANRRANRQSARG